jgi:Domain of unknown function (DUF3644)
MPKGLPQSVKDNLEKCRSAAIAAVDAYNRPGPRFRTGQYLVMVTIAWAALFHAIFFKRRNNPWYRTRSSGSGRAVRYQKIDGEPRHWDLAECLKQYYGSDNPPERKNLEFLLKLRNKIEHRHLPQLDVSLYGECQAALLNLEELIVKEFGVKFALMETLVVSLQFSSVYTPEKAKAARQLASTTAKTVIDYIEKFRGALSPAVLNSMKYSYSVFLVPRVTNRESAADAAVQFLRVDEASEEELNRLDRLNVLIKEKHIPIANIDLYKPTQVVAQIQARVPYRVTMATHTSAWKYFKVRPEYGATKPEHTKSEYCVFDPPHGDYLYTKAWIERLVGELSKPEKFKEITGRDCLVTPK